MSAINVTQVQVLVSTRARPSLAWLPVALAAGFTARGRTTIGLVTKPAQEAHALTLPVPHPAFPPQNNPQMFMTPLQFEIQYECLQPLANGRRAHRTFEPRPRSPKALK